MNTATGMMTVIIPMCMIRLYSKNIVMNIRMNGWNMIIRTGRICITYMSMRRSNGIKIGFC